MKHKVQFLFILLSSVLSLIVGNQSVDLYLDHSPFVAVAHLTCIIPSSDEKRDRNQIKDECCNAIVDKISYLCFEETFSSSFNISADVNMKALCGAALSTTEWSLPETKESNLKSLNLKCRQLLTHVPIKNEDKNLNDKIMFYMNRPIIFEMEEQQSYTTHVQTHVQKYVSSNGVQDWKRVISPFAANSEDGNCKMTAALHSHISSSGGMLRKFPQTIRLRGHFLSYNQSMQSNYKLNGKILLHLPISEGTFLDLDDPFQDDIQEPCSLLQPDDSESSLNDANVTCHVSVISPSTARDDFNPIVTGVIDIEQPSFVSPQHVVLIQLDFQIEFSSFPVHSQEVLVDLNFHLVPLIHVRYPMPIDDKTKDRIISLFIPTPFFYEADLQLTTDEEYDEKDKILIPICFDYTHNEKSYAEDRSLKSFYPIYIQVASGYDSHHDYVAIITTLVSLFGALKLLNSLSRSSHWI